MIDLERQFLSESIGRLARLKDDLNRQNAEALRREAFRAVHTIKGGAQVFGYAEAARAAYRLEDLLSGGGPAAGEPAFRAALAAGLDALAASLEENKKTAVETTESPPPATKEKGAAASLILFTPLPAATMLALSAAEKRGVRRALARRASICAVQADFARERLGSDYRRLNDALGEAGEVIAALPAGKEIVADGKIGFRFLLAADRAPREIERLAAQFSGRVDFYEIDAAATNALGDLFSPIVAHGRELAAAAGKTIDFGVLATAAAFSEKRRRTVFEALVHLVRNGVDHGIETEGRVEIELFAGREYLHLSVADDGRGLDPEKIRRRAVAAGLVGDAAALSDEQALQLVFAAGFSTAARVSAVSGRGVGLDAVKSAVEAEDGKISVFRRKEKGTIFEIAMPAENESEK